MSRIDRGCVKTSARFRTDLCEALKLSESKKFAKNLLCSILCKFSQFVPVDPRAALEAQSEGDAREANGETSRRCVLKIADSNEAQISKHAAVRSCRVRAITLWINR
jgi:hypothetical protein